MELPPPSHNHFLLHNPNSNINCQLHLPLRLLQQQPLYQDKTAAETKTRSTLQGTEEPDNLFFERIMFDTTNKIIGNKNYVLLQYQLANECKP